jgi:release factor glutamine methyltransferase
MRSAAGPGHRTGTGALALAAARAGAASVTAVNLSLRSVVAAWRNSRLHRVAYTVYRGDLVGPVAGQRFGPILAHPPYVPAATNRLPRYRISRCWDGGLDGRAVLDRIRTEGLLAPEGMMLLVHSAVCDDEVTLSRLTEASLDAEVLVRATVPFGLVMRARTAMLHTRGLIQRGQRNEQLVVISVRRAR